MRGDEVVADGHTEHACVDAVTLRPTRVPDWLADAIRTAEAAATPSA
jgi:acyl-CoA thioesterase FadM